MLKLFTFIKLTIVECDLWVWCMSVGMVSQRACHENFWEVVLVLYLIWGRVSSFCSCAAHSRCCGFCIVQFSRRRCLHSQDRNAGPTDGYIWHLAFLCGLWRSELKCFYWVSHLLGPWNMIYIKKQQKHKKPKLYELWSWILKREERWLQRLGTMMDFFLQYFKGGHIDVLLLL